MGDFPKLHFFPDFRSLWHKATSLTSMYSIASISAVVSALVVVVVVELSQSLLFITAVTVVTRDSNDEVWVFASCPRAFGPGHARDS